MSQPDKPMPIILHWLEPGQLAGSTLPRTEQDLKTIADLGIKLLVSLTEEWRPETDLISTLGMRSLYLPIKDYAIPELEPAAQTCATVQDYLNQNKPVALHCNAGKGRTGTMLSAQLIWQGKSAADAIHYARARNPDWIETAGQEQFLSDFALFLPHR